MNRKSRAARRAATAARRAAEAHVAVPVVTVTTATTSSRVSPACVDIAPATHDKPIADGCNPELPCNLCKDAGCAVCGKPPPLPRARTISALRDALRDACLQEDGIDLVPETTVIGTELSVRLVAPGGKSGSSWIDLGSLEPHGPRAVRWAARRAVDECIRDLARLMLILGPPVQAIRYVPPVQGEGRAP